MWGLSLTYWIKVILYIFWTCFFAETGFANIFSCLHRVCACKRSLYHLSMQTGMIEKLGWPVVHSYQPLWGLQWWKDWATLLKLFVQTSNNHIFTKWISLILIQTAQSSQMWRIKIADMNISELCLYLDWKQLEASQLYINTALGNLSRGILCSRNRGIPCGGRASPEVRVRNEWIL